MDRIVGVHAARVLKPEASVYVCCDWRSSAILQNVLEKYFIIRNRITWEREKGRGAADNWKNCLEDICSAPRARNIISIPMRLRSNGACLRLTPTAKALRKTGGANATQATG